MILDEISEEVSGKGEFVDRIGVEESVFVEEAVKETGEEFVIVSVVRLLCLSKGRDDFVDGNLLLVHAFVKGVTFGLDLGRERRDRHSRFRFRVLRGEVHESRVKLETLGSNLLEQLDIGSSEEFVTVDDTG